jgi:hypothetical protein
MLSIDVDGEDPHDRRDSMSEVDAPEPTRRRTRRRVVLLAFGIFAVLLLAIQLVPYRVTNPAVVQEPAWDSPRTRQLAVAACFNCHSNETETAWWEDIAPGSWWITNHVREGRAALNFSECRPGGHDDDAAETVAEGSMPPDYYTWLGLHSEAELTASERQQLSAGLRATLDGWTCGNGD